MKKLFLFMTFMMGCSLSSWAQTAFDSYLNLANHASIGEAYSQSDAINEIVNLYEYTQYQDAGVAWLTMPVWSAYRTSSDVTRYGVSSKTEKQEWIKVITPTNSVHPIFTSTSYKWINTSGGNNRTATNPFYGSNTYFGSTACVYGLTSSNTTKKTIAFYVTNCDQVKVYLNPTNNSNSSTPAKVAIYECTKNGNSLTASTTVDNMSYYKTTSFKIYTSPVLNTSKIYKVELSHYASRFYEIAFRTPINNTTIDATPTSLDFETRVGTSVTKTFHVSGTNLAEPITATLSDQNGVFSLSTTSVSVADGTAGTDISVTFDPNLQAFGTYNGTITLSSGNADNVVINLAGNAIDGYDLVISSAGLSTLYLNYPVSIPYDTYDPDLLGVFYIRGIGSDGKELLATRLNNIIPANTGVIVQGNSNTPDVPSYFFPRITDNQAASYAENSATSLLEGSTTEIPKSTVEGQNPGKIVYTLGRGKDSYINFYKYKGTTLAANKAFLLVADPSASAKSFTLNFDGDATGINTVDANSVDGAWYNLQGIQVQGQPTSKGVFIHNGKKVVVK